MGQDYDWEVSDPDSDDNLLIDGASQCEGGGFRLLVENLKVFNVDDPIRFKSMENNQQDEMVLVRSCGM